VPDPIFNEPILARIYDELEGARDDLDHYEALIDVLGARSVLDVGCGTGELACRLARRGLTVIGVDPAKASLDVARSKPDSDTVTWIHGDAGSLARWQVSSGAPRADLAIMTGNVAQVFLTDEAWAATLGAVHGAVRAGGQLVFETRNPARRAWEEWTSERSFETVTTSQGPVESWVDLLDVSLPFVTFRGVVRFLESGDALTSDSTLRFRDRDEIEASLATAGFRVDEIRDAPDRPGCEWVFVATSLPARAPLSGRSCFDAESYQALGRTELRGSPPAVRH
jgi:SAM-dependent methyltransferase